MIKSSNMFRNPSDDTRPKKGTQDVGGISVQIFMQDENV